MRSDPGSRFSIDYAVRDVVPYINWIYFFHAWGMEPRFATVADIHDCPSCRAGWVASFPEADQPKAREAATLYAEATTQLHQWADEPMCHALLLLAEAYSDGDDIVIDGKRIPFLRQQHARRLGYTLCLSDFIAPRRKLPIGADNIANRIGVFAASIKIRASERESSLLEFLQQAQPKFNNEVADHESGVSDYEHRPQSSSLFPLPSPLITSTLADRLAEATAEKLHEEVRRHIWGYAKEERLTMRELHDEKFQGIRPAVGYPSLPDQSINFLIDELLGLKEIGITLTPNGAMSPSASVSGFMLAHPQAHYFSIGSIGEDQLLDYSRRRGIEPEALRNFLTNNL